MKRMLGPALVGLGVFLVVAAGLVRFYAYPALADLPEDFESVTDLSAEGAQVLSYETFAAETHDLEITSYTVADQTAETPDDVVVWQNSTTVKRADGTTFQQSRERAPFDADTGEATTCEGCPSWVEVSEDGDVTQEQVTREGLVYKFPFHTEKRDYEVWDGTLGEAVTAEFQGVTEIEGLEVYEFTQEIPETVVETREGLPGSMFDAQEASVDADMVYGMTRTFFVEPATGSPVDRIEQRTQELVHEGTSVPVFTGSVSYTDDEVAGNVEDLELQAPLLSSLRMLVPVALLVVGALLLGLGLLLNPAGRTRRTAHAGDRSLVNA